MPIEVRRKKPKKNYAAGAICGLASYILAFVIAVFAVLAMLNGLFAGYGYVTDTPVNVSWDFGGQIADIAQEMSLRKTAQELKESGEIEKLSPDEQKFWRMVDSPDYIYLTPEELREHRYIRQGGQGEAHTDTQYTPENAVDYVMTMKKDGVLTYWVVYRDGSKKELTWEEFRDGYGG